jgi:hypothetical protein
MIAFDIWRDSGRDYDRMDELESTRGSENNRVTLTHQSVRTKSQDRRR